MTDILLGKTIHYTDQYDSSLLFPVPRTQNRAQIGLRDDALPFHGIDIWNAWELSWLNAKGKPVVARGEFRFSASSPHIVESKSFKLYLNSFNGTRFDSIESVRNTLQRDLALASGGPVVVILHAEGESGEPARHRPDAVCIDTLDISCEHYELEPQLLAGSVTEATPVVDESLYSQLLKSNCPVTGQPDWATVFISYRGPRIDHAALLRYIVSFRNHAEFHEHCVERIFTDLMQHCHCEALSVYARYTRRGGLDINPWRSTHVQAVDNCIMVRQ